MQCVVIYYVSFLFIYLGLNYMYCNLSQAIEHTRSTTVQQWMWRHLWTYHCITMNVTSSLNIPLYNNECDVIFEHTTVQKWMLRHLWTYHCTAINVTSSLNILVVQPYLYKNECDLILMSLWSSDAARLKQCGVIRKRFDSFDLTPSSQSKHGF